MRGQATEGRPVTDQTHGPAGAGVTDERIVDVDGLNRTLTHSVRSDGLPSLVTGLQNTWTVLGKAAVGLPTISRCTSNRTPSGLEIAALCYVAEARMTTSPRCCHLA